MQVLFGKWQPSGKQGRENTEQEIDANREKKLTAVGLILCVTTSRTSPYTTAHRVCDILCWGHQGSTPAQCQYWEVHWSNLHPPSHVLYTSWVSTCSLPDPFPFCPCSTQSSGCFYLLGSPPHPLAVNARQEQGSSWLLRLAWLKELLL